MTYQQLIAHIERVIDRPNKSPQEIRQIAQLLKERMYDLSFQFSLEDLERAVAQLKDNYHHANRQVERFHSQVYQFGVTLAVLLGIATGSTLGFKVCCVISFVIFLIWYYTRSQSIYDRQSLAGDRLATLELLVRDYRVSRLGGGKQRSLV